MASYRLVAFDPGEMTGYAIFEVHPDRPEDTFFVDLGQFHHKDAFEKISELVTDETAVVVVEDYRVFHHKAKAHSGSKLITTRVIGSMEYRTQQVKARMVQQPSNILPIAQKWSGITLGGNHAQSHQFSAVNHGFFYLVKQKHAITNLERKKIQKASASQTQPEVPPRSSLSAEDIDSFLDQELG